MGTRGATPIVHRNLPLPALCSPAVAARRPAHRGSMASSSISLHFAPWLPPLHSLDQILVRDSIDLELHRFWLIVAWMVLACALEAADRLCVCFVSNGRALRSCHPLHHMWACLVVGRGRVPGSVLTWLHWLSRSVPSRAFPNQRSHDSYLEG
jgi:hypothetical protein